MDVSGIHLFFMKAIACNSRVDVTFLFRGIKGEHHLPGRYTCSSKCDSTRQKSKSVCSSVPLTSNFDSRSWVISKRFFLSPYSPIHLSFDFVFSSSFCSSSRYQGMRSNTPQITWDSPSPTDNRKVMDPETYSTYSESSILSNNPKNRAAMGFKTFSGEYFSSSPYVFPFWWFSGTEW